MLINPVAGVEVLESREEYFIDHMDAQMVSEALQSKKVIPVHIQMKIMEAATRQEANYILFDYLMSNGTKSSLLALCEVVKTAKGASEKMAKLGEGMLLTLEQGVCICTRVYVCVRWCACVCVYMRCVYVCVRWCACVYVCICDVCNVSGIHE